MGAKRSQSPPASSPTEPVSPRLLTSDGMDFDFGREQTQCGAALNVAKMLYSFLAVHVVILINTLVDPPTERICRKALAGFLCARKRSKFLVFLIVLAAASFLVTACWRLVNFCVFILFPGYLFKHTLLYLTRQCGTAGTRPKGTIKRVLLVCDCSDTQVCGVLRKFYAMIEQLEQQGYEVHTIQTNRFDTRFYMPFFPEVQCAVYTPYLQAVIGQEIERFNPDAINIMTEGTLGVATRMHCRVMNRRFSTMFCTRYDVGVEISCMAAGVRLGSPVFGRCMSGFLGYITRMYVRWFHCQSLATITPSPTMGRILEAQELAPNVQVPSTPPPTPRAVPHPCTPGLVRPRLGACACPLSAVFVSPLAPLAAPSSCRPTADRPPPTADLQRLRHLGLLAGGRDLP